MIPSAHVHPLPWLLQNSCQSQYLLPHMRALRKYKSIPLKVCFYLCRIMADKSNSTPPASGSTPRNGSQDLFANITTCFLRLMYFINLAENQVPQNLESTAPLLPVPPKIHRKRKFPDDEGPHPLVDQCKRA